MGRIAKTAMLLSQIALVALSAGWLRSDYRSDAVVGFGPQGFALAWASSTPVHDYRLTGFDLSYCNHGLPADGRNSFAALVAIPYIFLVLLALQRYFAVFRREMKQIGREKTQQTQRRPRNRQPGPIAIILSHLFYAFFVSFRGQYLLRLRGINKRSRAVVLGGQGRII